MKKNSEFNEYFFLIKEGKKGLSSEDFVYKVRKEVKRIVSLGWATPNLRVVYDLGIEKYRTIGQDSISVKTYDKERSVRNILKHTFAGYLPKGILEYIPCKELIFHPHKPAIFEEDGLNFANLFIKNKFLSYKPKKRIEVINWNKYPNIKALFENVFKTEDRMNYFINWLAYGMQTLEKAQTAIISKGIQGTGKGVIYKEIIQYAIGEKYTTLLENEALKSRFNGELENKLFVLANEVKADFREGNTSYERLKMYITDSEIRFEEKNTKARTIPNFFNIWFHSNNDVPLQIQGSDRRYTVFNTKNKKLVEVSEKLGFDHISDYIEAIREERDKFIYDIMSVKYDKYEATTPQVTEEKEIVYQTSMSKIDVLGDKIKKLDFDYFRDGLEEADDSDNEDVTIREFAHDLNADDVDGVLAIIKAEFTRNYISNRMASFLYKIFVNEKESYRKVGISFNKLFGKALLKKVNGKVIKYRKINPDREVTIVNIERVVKKEDDSYGIEILDDNIKIVVDYDEFHTNRGSFKEKIQNSYNKTLELEAEELF